MSKAFFSLALLGSFLLPHLSSADEFGKRKSFTKDGCFDDAYGTDRTLSTYLDMLAYHKCSKSGLYAHPVSEVFITGQKMKKYQGVYIVRECGKCEYICLPTPFVREPVPKRLP